MTLLSNLRFIKGKIELLTNKTYSLFTYIPCGSNALSWVLSAAGTALLWLLSYELVSTVSLLVPLLLMAASTGYDSAMLAS